MNTREIVNLKHAVNEGDHVSGSATAPVTLVEYGNFECIDCGRIYPAIKEVQKRLGENLRFVFRHFPTVRTHPRSLRSAEASEAAAAQNKFWNMHDELFTHQQSLDDSHLSRYAKRIGLDTERFAREMTNNMYVGQLDADYQRNLFDEHITGTPTLFINSVRYTGSTDVEGLLLAIKEADTEGLINFGEKAGKRNVLNWLHQHSD